MFQSILDFFQRHYTITLILFFLFSGGYLLVTEFWYFGTEQFFISEKQTILKIEGKGEFLCTEKNCSQEIIPGKYKFSVEKENYETVFGEIELSMQKISEKKIILKQKSTQVHNNIQNVVKKEFIKTLKTLNTLSIEETIPSDFTISEEKLQYKNIVIHTTKNKQIPLVSSDEVGRGYWIISPEKIQLFTPNTQNISTHLKKQASSDKQIFQFVSLQDGSFITNTSQEINKILWKPFKKPEIKLNISPFSISAICKAGASFVYLKNNDQEVEVIQYNPDTSKKTHWGILEKFPKDDFHSIQCFQGNSVTIFFNSHKSIVLKNQ